MRGVHAVVVAQGNVPLASMSLRWGGADAATADRIAPLDVAA